jgi:LacI family transcriptional regulator
MLGRASIKDVAARAGVAVSSVSRVLAEHPDVSAEMRKRVLKAVRDTGYEPNSVARSLRRGTSMSVGFVAGDISNPLMAEIGLGVETRLAQDGYSVVLANSRGLPASDAANISMFRQRLVDGLLLSITDEKDAATGRQLRQYGKPIVLLDREISTTTPAGAVLFDHRAGFEQAAEHLVGLGHKRVALIAGAPTVRPTRERVAAVEAVLASARLRPTIVLGSLGREQGHSAAAELLGSPPAPTAIICGGNQLLPGVLTAIRERGLRIPDDVSVVTTDSIELAEFYEPPIAVIGRDPHAFGVAAAEMLLELLNGDTAESPVVLPTHFQATGSCAPAP